MSDDNGKEREHDAKYEGPRIMSEPWRKEKSGLWVVEGDGHIVPHRESIKVRADAPHIAVVVPMGAKEEVDVHVCDTCGTRTKGQKYRAPGLVSCELFLNQMQMMMPLNVSVTFLMMKNNLSSILREVMTKQALDMGVNFIFYWDDDVLLPPDVWYKMLNWMSRDPSIGIITGVYYTKLDPPEPVLYKHASTGAHWGHSLDPNDPPEDIYACGAGCMMARAEAVAKMKPPYWFDQRTASTDGAHTSILGHDIRFCRQMHETEYRDGEMYRVTVDGSIQCLHFDHRQQRAYARPDQAVFDEKGVRDQQGRWVGIPDPPADVYEDALPNERVSVEEVEAVIKEG